jgi:hypothetical protein
MQYSHNNRISRFLILKMLTINSFSGRKPKVFNAPPMLHDMFFVGVCVLTKQKFVRISLNRAMIRDISEKAKIIYIPLSEEEFDYVWHAQVTIDNVMYIFKLLEDYIINKGEIYFDQIEVCGPHKYPAMYWTSHRAACKALPPLAALSRSIKISIHNFMSFAHPISLLDVFNVCNQHHAILNEPTP